MNMQMQGIKHLSGNYNISLHHKHIHTHFWGFIFKIRQNQWTKQNMFPFLDQNLLNVL